MKTCDGTTDIQLYKIRTEFLPLLRHNWVVCPVRYQRSIVAGLFELGLVYHSHECSSSIETALISELYFIQLLKCYL